MPTVLVVDDEEIVRKWVNAVLSAFGCKVIEACGSCEALKILGSQRVDVLFSDCLMPGEMSGPDLAKVTVGLYPEMRIILMSGCYDQGLHLPDGWTFLRKPFKPSDLRRAVDPYIGDPQERTDKRLAMR